MADPIVIVGAGITGLALAFTLRQRGVEVLLLEASDRAGGVVRTLDRGGIRLEQGPQSLRSAGAGTAALVEELGLIERVVGASPAARKRYLLHHGRLQPLPSGPLDLLRGGPLRRRAILRALAEPLVPSRPLPGESIDALVRRRFGAGIAEPVLDAFVAGIYAGDARQMEAEAGFPTLAGAEREHGSVLGGMLRRPRAERPDWLPAGSFTFDEGIETFTRALAARIDGVLRLSTPVHGVATTGRSVRVHTADGPIDAAHAVVTAPPWVARDLVPAWAPLLDPVPASPVAAVHLGWRAGEGPRLDGFGWLAPSSERQDVLGAIWVSSTFPHLAPGLDLVRVMVGGTRAPHLARLAEGALADHALELVRQVQGPVPPPALVQVAVHAPGIPQYVAGHASRVRRLQAAVPRVHALGWGVTGIGLAQGLDATRALADRLAA